ncbi:Angiogenic factor with G patch and FHA domains 1 [Grifola frondosa]|uniref:Angiogenic factor with G patch and FHA domains 1 n=1 Tax=Grifola frondosa TaxID=5627 RepID=A0A1C7M5L1_GRIFR|nr:Angiogenic factor with G patch and FHA domains 1 [Grifola frondosa]
MVEEGEIPSDIVCDELSSTLEAGRYLTIAPAQSILPRSNGQEIRTSMHRSLLMGHLFRPLVMSGTPQSHGTKPGPPSNLSPSLRLVVQQSSILPKQRTTAMLDGYSEIHIGRDTAPPGSDIPRIRLKEMEVSKLHATVYWDQNRHEWSIVDMGSKHGTFIQSPRGSGPLRTVDTIDITSIAGDMHADTRGLRLSPARVASIPRRLGHLDRLGVGGTTFVVHIHDDLLPCVDCSPQPGAEIPLFALSRAESEREAGRKRKLDMIVPISGQDHASSGRDTKKALTMLKRSLLSRHSAPPSSTSSTHYVDRSERRRTFHPETAENTPCLARSAPPPIPRPEPPTPPVSTPATPLSSTNIGHQLLLKQGWLPGTSLGRPDSRDVALTEPLQDASVNVCNYGLERKRQAETMGKLSDRRPLAVDEVIPTTDSRSQVPVDGDVEFRFAGSLPYNDVIGLSALHVIVPGQDF